VTAQRTRTALVLLAAGAMTAGCLGTDKDLKFFNDSELKYYKGVAQKVDYSDVQSETAHQALSTKPPRTIDGPRTAAERKNDKVRDMSLMEAIHTALANNRIIRTANGFLVGSSVYGNPASIYDPAIQESGILFGNRGVEAALSDFDTTFSTSMLWGRSETVQNNIFFGGGLTPGSTLQQDTGTFRSALSKRFADGGSFLVGHDWDYRGALVPGQLFPSVYTGNLRAEYRRPLWAAAGTEYTRIAGPTNPNFGAITGVSQGVVIARINSDISIADFEANVRNLVSDVQNAYWDLYLQYRQYDTAVVARNSAKATWERLENIRKGGGLEGFALQDEAQARDQYYARLAQTNETLNALYSAEIRLRRLLGLPVNDGHVIRPSDEPTMGKRILDWEVSLAEALTQRVELRRQKWSIKSLELQLKAAKSLTNPRLDFVSSGQVNGFGDRLFGENDNDVAGTAQGLDSAYETLTQGNQTGWTLGFEFSMPLGFRSARAQVRNIELRLLKERQKLAAQELEVSHELAVAFQNVAVNYANMKANYERIQAARERLRIFEQLKKVGGLQNVTADIVLRAQNDLAQAESAFYLSRVNYDKAVSEVEYRKGSLLEYHGVYLAEDEWTPKAYQQALRRARARSHALQNHKLLHTEPAEFALPPACPTCPGGVAPVESNDPNWMQPVPEDSQQPVIPPKPAHGEEPPDSLPNDNPLPQREGGVTIDASLNVGRAQLPDPDTLPELQILGDSTHNGPTSR